MELALKEGGNLKLNDAVFSRDFGEALVHQVVVAYLAGGRAGTKAQKTRSQVAGGGRKPWKQKGTGRARAGTIRSPLWRGGGKTFAAVPRDHSQKVNRKMYRAAMQAIFSELVRQNRLDVVKAIPLEAPKTAQLAAWLGGFDGRRVLILVDELAMDLYLAARNLPDVAVSEAALVDPVSLVGADRVIATADAIKRIEEWLS